MADLELPDDNYDGGSDPQQEPQEDLAKLALTWRRKITRAKKFFEKQYFPRVTKIIKRYRDERDDEATNRGRRYNLLWSNVEVLKPAVYGQPPKPYVSRRYQDRDPIARVACQVLERTVSYDMDCTDFDAAMTHVRDDYLLGGRGVTWQRYEGKITQVTAPPDPATGQPAIDPMTGQPQVVEKLAGESAPTDYVNLKDFLHDPAKIWTDVRWVSRTLLVTKEQAKERQFKAEDIAQMSFTHKRVDDDKSKERSDGIVDDECALIYEIWDKDTRRAIWLSLDVNSHPLDIKEDPLKLRGFFPCTQPLFATTTNDTLVPVPDFIQYQDQAKDIDTLTDRIALLVRALAVRGGYDASNPALKTLLDERPENFIVPVTNWAAFAEKGGMTGGISFLPLKEIADAIVALHNERAALVMDVYQITGISDIVRGQGQGPKVTATEQRIKGSFASLRLQDRQKNAAKFSRDALRLKAEVISEHFEPDNLRKMSGFDNIAEVEDLKQQNPQGVEQLWQQVYQMLKDDELRLFHLDIETDSTIQADITEEQGKRTEFLAAVGSFMQTAMPMAMQMPQFAPVVGKMLQFGVRGFRVGRELEAVIETAVEQLQRQAQQPPQAPPPDPRVLALQAKSQRDDAKVQGDLALSQRKQQATEQSQAQEAALDHHQFKVRSQLELITALGKLGAQSRGVH